MLMFQEGGRRGRLCLLFVTLRRCAVACATAARSIFLFSPCGWPSSGGASPRACARCRRQARADASSSGDALTDLVDDVVRLPRHVGLLARGLPPARIRERAPARDFRVDRQDVPPSACGIQR